MNKTSEWELKFYLKTLLVYSCWKFIESSIGTGPLNRLEFDVFRKVHYFALRKRVARMQELCFPREEDYDFTYKCRINNIDLLHTLVFQIINEELYIFRSVILLGDSAVGKSNILSKYTLNHFNFESKTTIGVEFSTKVLEIDSKTIKVSIWDTAGQERYRAITRAYYRGAVGALIVYDITNKISFQNLEKWIKEIKNSSDEDDIVLALIGNKSDLSHLRAISTEEGAQFAEKHGTLFAETSALLGTNLDDIFTQMITKIHKNTCQPNPEGTGEEKILSESVKLKIPDHQPTVKKSCC